MLGALQALPNPVAIPSSQIVFTVTWGILAILLIVGFVVGFVISIAVVLAKRRYGIWTYILREIGYTYKIVGVKMRRPTDKDFRFRNRGFQIDLSKTAWLDLYGRPVLFYTLENVAPIEIKNTTEKLAKVVEAMEIKMAKRGSDPSDPFDMLFGRKVIEALARAMRRGKPQTGMLIGLLLLGLVLGLSLGYILGNFAPLPNLHPIVTAVHNSTSTSIAGGINR